MSFILVNAFKFSNYIDDRVKLLVADIGMTFYYYFYSFGFLLCIFYLSVIIY